MLQSKHIIRIIFLLLFTFILVNTFFYRYFMFKEIVLPDTADNGKRIAQLYQTQIWNEYPNIASKVNNETAIKLIADEEFIEFARKTIKFFEAINLEKVNFYNNDKASFLSTNDKDIKIIRKTIDAEENELTFYNKIDNIFLKSNKSINLVNKALKSPNSEGNILSDIAPVARVKTNSEGVGELRNLIRVYIPLISNKNGAIKAEGVIELYFDANKQWQKIEKLEQRVMLAAIIIFSLFLMIIMYSTHHAQKIINKQQEANIELSAAKQRAENESSEKSEFLANISHELRTPLNAIIGFSEIMITESMGKIGNSQYKDYINDINNSGKHLLSVINDILDFSKAQAEKLKIDTVEVDLTKVSTSSMRFVKPRADEAKVNLVTDVPNDRIIIVADAKRLKQALLNLLSNSVKFTPAGGSVTLSIKFSKNKKLVKLLVEDTGIGIAEEDIPKALSSFGQVDNKHSRKYEGTGLGLPLTKKLVELMKGRFDITSKPGKGTKVTLTFPTGRIIKRKD